MPDPGLLPRLGGDTLKDRLNRLFEMFPNPATGRPWTNADAAAAITAAGTPISENTLANARRGDHEPTARRIGGIADHFGVDPGYLYPGSVAEQRELRAAEDVGPTEEELAGVARLFNLPPDILADTAAGNELDAEIALLLAMRAAGVVTQANRHESKPDPQLRRDIAAALLSAARRRGQREPSADSDGDDRVAP
jgi:transcriptional regulator with XRE-family HTH domain